MHTVPAYSEEQGGGSRLKPPSTLVSFPWLPSACPSPCWAPILPPLVLVQLSTRAKAAGAKKHARLWQSEQAWTWYYIWRGWGWPLLAFTEAVDWELSREIKEEIRKHLKTNENKNTAFKNLWDTAKIVIRRKFTVIQAYLNKQQKSEMNNLTYYLKKWEKGKA